jgi:hypothetical protein
VCYLASAYTPPSLSPSLPQSRDNYIKQEERGKYGPLGGGDRQISFKCSIFAPPRGGFFPTRPTVYMALIGTEIDVK